MTRWLIDEKGVVTGDHIVMAAQLGFSVLAIAPVNGFGGVVDQCVRSGLGVIPIIANWGDIKKEHPDMAFRNHEGKSSFDSDDPLVAPNNWPSLWHPEAMDLIRPQFKLAAEAAGEALAGFAIGTGHGDASCMPINWHRCERGNELSNDYWVFGEYAVAEYQRVYHTEDEPCAHPAEDHDLRTLNLIQAAMLRRMNDMALAAREYDSHIWAMILPFPSCSYVNMAAGYGFGMHQRWARWAREFEQAHDAEVGFLMLHVLEDAVPNQVAQAAAMANPHLDSACLVGIHNAADDLKRAEDLGLTGVLCAPEHLEELAQADAPEVITEGVVEEAAEGTAAKGYLREDERE